jgi:hypothetical protein
MVTSRNWYTSAQKVICGIAESGGSSNIKWLPNRRAMDASHVPIQTAKQIVTSGQIGREVGPPPAGQA